MYRLLAALGRGLKHRIGWKQLGIAASLIIIAFAITTLVRTLKGVDTGVLLVALTEIAPHRIALAALCVVGAFCTLTFYDFFALRTIGRKHVPYRIAALSSFTSYTIGDLVAAQLMEAARRAIPTLDQGIERGSLIELVDWLGTNVHALGARHSPDELVVLATGRELSTEAWIQHVTGKRGGLDE